MIATWYPAAATEWDVSMRKEGIWGATISYILQGCERRISFFILVYCYCRVVSFPQ